jgi:hypothetical protein
MASIRKPDPSRDMLIAHGARLDTRTRVTFAELQRRAGRSANFHIDFN